MHLDLGVERVIQRSQQFFQAIKNREHNDECSGDEGNTAHGEDGNDINEICLPLREQVTPGDEKG